MIHTHTHTHTHTRTCTCQLVQTIPWKAETAPRQNIRSPLCSKDCFLGTEAFFFFFDWIFKTVLHLRFQKASLGCQGESRELGREEEGHWDVYTSWCSLYCLTRQGYCSLFTGKKAEAGRSVMPKSKTCQEATVRTGHGWFLPFKSLHSNLFNSSEWITQLL